MEKPGLLAIADGEMHALTVSDALTKPLCELLSNSTDARDAAQQVVRRPAMLEECHRVLSQVTRLAAPVSVEDAYRICQPLVLMYGEPNYGDTDGLATAWWGVYLKAIGDLPREALEHAVSEYIRTTTKPYFPKPSELQKLALPRANIARMLSWRVRKACEEQPSKVRHRTAEDAAAIRQMAAEFMNMPKPKQIGYAPVARRANDALVQEIVAEGLRR